MKQFDARSYSIADFIEWNAGQLLDLSPKFQRRSVWTRAAKSFLIDTVLRGKPMPKVLLTQDLVGKKNVRTVVDGQQRIRTILEFVSDGFTVLAAHNADHAGKTFSALDDDTQGIILQYELGVDLLYNVSLSDMLDIFARINTYSVTLNTQEKLNAKYLGVFKTAAYELGHAYVGYVLDGGVLSEKAISRMGEAQLASDLLVALVGGVQTVKNIERYYRLYESKEVVPPEVASAIELYNETMRYIGAIYPAQELAGTNWARSHWFYTLFTCVAHALQPLVGLEDADRPSLTQAQVIYWRGQLDELSALYDRYTEDTEEDVPAAFARFINYAQRRTTDTEARRERAKYVLAALEL
ncbi:DUF262 domain-containing protein [Sphingomonas nostoxanthinifaciens]|uniref:DUF262 domain-containing protein n=1 Tax=Sphingomonas nostoxanthinifaciens TaxID=2872652 RepID=UPI001CC20749|nr:DUF262 domain-containing protein [Sphingomonas nostoxanthinifaciens]UAK24163.1 DUF262 domain-containing protein [Sphingomonas nostoxanthinifaciens]